MPHPQKKNDMRIWRFLKRKLHDWKYRNESDEDFARRMGVEIGENCLIETRNFGSEPYLINIGNNVQVTHDVWFHTHGGAHVARRWFPRFDVFGKIKIEDWAYIGASSHIMAGVTIGEGSLVAGGSIVVKSVPPNELWGGARPGSFVRSRII